MRILELNPFADMSRTRGLWTAAEARCPGASPFVRWPWVGSWLRHYGAALAPILYVARDGRDEVRGAALVGRRLILRRRILPVRQLYLNTAGEAEEGGVCVEYNQLLCAPADAAPFMSALLRRLGGAPSWDELSLPGFLPEHLPSCAGLRERRRRVCYGMDLLRLRGAGFSPEAALSSNTRQQVRRSLRLFGGRESLRIVQAQTRDQALRMLDELVALHQASWQARGQRGAFADGPLHGFLRGVIDLGHPDSIALLALRDGDGQTIGVSVYLLEQRTAYFYQSGLRMEPDPRCKPGLCLHLLAMEHFLAQGRALYDFMASDLRYKQSLSNSERTMVWGVLQRPRLRLWIERLAVNVRDELVPWLRPAPADPSPSR